METSGLALNLSKATVTSTVLGALGICECMDMCIYGHVHEVNMGKGVLR